MARECKKSNNKNQLGNILKTIYNSTLPNKHFKFMDYINLKISFITYLSALVVQFCPISLVERNENLYLSLSMCR